MSVPRSSNGDQSAFSVKVSDESRIRDAAARCLTASFARLREEGVLPRVRFRPWIWMARDYFGDMVERDNGPLAQALQQAVPQRFEWLGGEPIDSPWGYAAALVEAAVAAATLADEPYDIASPSVLRAIKELVDKVRAVPSTKTVQVVGDIDVTHEQPPPEHPAPLGQTIEIGGVRIIRVENHAERFIEIELPSAGYEVERTHVVNPGAASLFISTSDQIAGYGARLTACRAASHSVLTAIRLGTGATARPTVDIEGEPGRVRCISPIITPLQPRGFSDTHRAVSLSEHMVPALSDLAALVRAWSSVDDWSAVRVATGRFGRSFDGNSDIADTIIDISIGLEAALAGSETSEIGLRLRTRAADILSTASDPPESIYRDVKTLYELRSTLVHGGLVSGKRFRQAIEKVTAAGGGTLPGDRYLVALDRWRDLLRRAILARIALASAKVAWGAGHKTAPGVDVDELLRREHERNAWRRHIKIFWADRGLPIATEAASPPKLTVDVLTDRSNAPS